MITQQHNRWVGLVQVGMGLVLGGMILLALPGISYAAWWAAPQATTTPTITPTVTFTVLVNTRTATPTQAPITVLVDTPTGTPPPLTPTGTVLVSTPSPTPSVSETVPPLTPTGTVLVATASPPPPVSETVPPSATPASTVTPACGPAWRSVPGPNIGGLQGISASGPDDIWAVSDSLTTGILHWNGSAWNPVPYPTATGAPNFRAVAASGPTSAWAGGAAQGFLPAQMQYWDGAVWQIICCAADSARAPGTTYDFFSTIVALGSDPQYSEAYAVRVQGVGTVAWSTLMRCTATTCAELTTLSNTHFTGVAAVAGNDIWVAGGGLSHWDGTSLSAVFSPPSGALWAVAARAGNDVWAVGSRYDGVTGHSLLAHWDGQSWSMVSTPDIGALTAVTARAADDAWAVGQGILHWDGSQWTQVLTLNATLSGVTALAAGDVWAVGLSGPSDSLLLHYTPQLFADVPPIQTFYPYIQWMACRNIISGYPCGGPGEPCPGAYYRVGNAVTRGQLLKMVVNAAGWPPVNPATATFEDVPFGSPFSPYIETGVSHGIINGYPCGGPFEPCLAPINRPYFRPFNNATRGQMSKIAANAFFPGCQTPARR